MPLLRKNSIIAAALEAAEGVAETIVVGDVLFVVQDVTYKPESQLIERNIIGPSFARKNFRPTQKLARVTFKTEIVGSGTAAVAPNWAMFLLACGFKQTTTTTVVWDPVTNVTFSGTPPLGVNGGGTLTIWVYEDGMVKKMRGCRGTCRVTGEAAGLAYFEWEFMGILDAPAPATFPALDASYDSGTPPLVESALFALHGTSLLIKSFSIDIGNSVVPRYNASSVAGVQSIFIADRVVTGSIDPEHELPATFDPITRMNTPTVGAFTITIGSVSGNKIIITAPAAQVQVTSVDEGDRDGLLTSPLNLAFTVPMIESATDKEIRFTHST